MLSNKHIKQINIKMSSTIYQTYSTSIFEIKSSYGFQRKEIKLNYYVNKREIEKIIQRILIDFCNISILGYDKNEDTYWCKKYNGSSCILYIKFRIHLISFDLSEISIAPILGDKTDINIFVYDFNDAMQMYKTSNFIKNLLCSY